MSDHAILVHITTPDGAEHTLEGLSGWSLMQTIRDWQLPIKAECGGACACATCHVYVQQACDALPPAHDEELERLDEAPNVRPQSRLACQIILSPALSGLRVALAPGSEP